MWGVAALAGLVSAALAYVTRQLPVVQPGQDRQRQHRARQGQEHVTLGARTSPRVPRKESAGPMPEITRTISANVSSARASYRLGTASSAIIPRNLQFHSPASSDCLNGAVRSTMPSPTTKV